MRMGRVRSVAVVLGLGLLLSSFGSDPSGTVGRLLIAGWDDLPTGPRAESMA
jgi:hypothetical protein